METESAAATESTKPTEETSEATSGEDVKPPPEPMEQEVCYSFHLIVAICAGHHASFGGAWGYSFICIGIVHIYGGGIWDIHTFGGLLHLGEFLHSSWDILTGKYV